MKKLYTILASLAFVFTSAGQSIISVSPSTIPSFGSVTLTLKGYHTSFTQYSGYVARLTQPDVNPSSTFNSISATVLDDETIQATFNIAGPQYGGYYRVELIAGGGYLINWRNDGVFMTGIGEKKIISCSPAVFTAGSPTFTAQVSCRGTQFMIGSSGTASLTSEEGQSYTINEWYSIPSSDTTLDVTFTGIPANAINGYYRMTLDETFTGQGYTYKSDIVRVVNGVYKGVTSVSPNWAFKGDSVNMIVTVTGTNLTSFPLNYTLFRLNGENNTYSLSVGSTAITTIDATHALIRMRISPFAPEGDYYLQLYNNELGYFYKHHIFRVNPPKLGGIMYEDANSNGVMDVNEYGLMGKKVLLLPDSIYGVSNQSGYYTFNPDSGQYSIAYVPDTEWTLTSSPATYSNILANDTVIQGLDFGGLDTNQQYKHLFTVTTFLMRCLQTGHSRWQIYNPSPNTQNGLVRQIHSANLPVIYTQITPDSVNGDTLFWNYTIGPYATMVCSLQYQNPAAGNTVWYNNLDQVYDGLGNVVQQYYSAYSAVTTCSYDPNDKSVMPLEDVATPYTDIYSDLTYNIRFQNTGTDTAFLVVIKDTLSPFLDLSTFNVVSSSHPVMATLGVHDRIATFTFENIQLPDSIIDEPASHGFVRYNIRPLSGLPDSTDITNTSYIYFDYNEPVQTNTTLSHLIYVYHPTALFNSSDTSFCAGQCLQFTNMSDSSTSWQWYFPGSSVPSTTVQSPQDICYSNPGMYNVTLIATNAYTSDTLFLPNFIVVNPNPVVPTITQINDTLFSSTNPAYVSYQWYLNNVLISGATDTLYVAPVSGNYSVVVTDANGCSNTADVDIVLNVHSVHDAGIVVYPNPVNDKLYIRNDNENVSVILTDELGRTIIYQKAGEGKETVIDVSKVAAGIYTLKVISKNSGQSIIKIIKE
jgi:hypothetical protein